MVLQTIVHGILCRDNKLHYYQGFHDVCLVFLLILTPKPAFAACVQTSRFYLRDAMSLTLGPVVQLLSLIYPLVGLEDKTLSDFFHQAESKPYFALSWVITWFAHDVESRGVVERIYDFLISSHPLMPIYLSAAVSCVATFPTTTYNGSEFIYFFILAGDFGTSGPHLGP